jgi:hypothetical protein
MNSDNRQQSKDREPVVQRVAKGIVAAIAEAHEAQRMLFERRMDPESYVFWTAGAPDTYADFLFRTSGRLRHEPSACERALGPGHPGAAK